MPVTSQPVPDVVYHEDNATPGDQRALTAALARAILSARERAEAAEAEEQREEEPGR